MRAKLAVWHRESSSPERVCLIAIATSIGVARAAPPEPAPPEPAPPPLTDPSSPDPDVRPQRHLRLLGRLQFDFGGQKIIGVKLSDGRDQSLQAGQGASLSGGLMYQSTFPVAVEATMGVKLALFTAPNGHVEFTRIPLDVIVSAAGVAHRVGIGATTHFRPTLGGRVEGMRSTSVTLDTAHGFILQYAYSTEHSNRRFELGVRITLLSYVVDGEAIEANSTGIFASGRL